MQPRTVLKELWWNFPVIVPLTWRWSSFTEVMYHWLLPVMALCHFFSSKSCLFNSSAVFIGFWSNLSIIVPVTWKAFNFTEVDCLLQELWPFVSFSYFIKTTEILVTLPPLSFFKGFYQTFRILFCHMAWIIFYHIYKCILSLVRFCGHNSSFSFQEIFIKLPNIVRTTWHE